MNARGLAVMAAACLLVVPRRASADDETSPPVSPERPDVSYNATLVAPGALQWEMGFDGAIPPIPDTRVALLMPMTFRIGVHPRVEVDALDGDLLPWLARSEGPGRGLAVAVKLRLNLPAKASKAPRIVLRPYLQSAEMGAAFSGQAPAVGLFAVMTQPLGDKASLDVNAGGHIDPNRKTEERGDLRASASFSFEASKWMRPFAELYVRGDPAQWKQGTFSLDAGFVFPVHPTVAIDVAGRADALAQQRAYAVLAGLSFVVQAWRPRRAARS